MSPKGWRPWKASRSSGARRPLTSRTSTAGPPVAPIPERAERSPAPLVEFLDRSPDSLLLEETAEPGRYPMVGCGLRDLTALRETRVPSGIHSPLIGVHLADDQGALALVPRPEWPPLLAFRSLPGTDGRWTVIRFARPIDVAALLHELGLQSVWPDLTGDRGLLVLDHLDEPSETLPPDVVVGTDTWPDSDVPRRTPLFLRDPSGPLRLGPVDERVLNPIGFLAVAPDPVVHLADLDLRDGVTARLVRDLRTAAGVRVQSWDDQVAHVVAALGVAGVPVVSEGAPAELLGKTVAAAINAPVDLANATAREEHSIVLRRAALDTFASAAWRAEVGARAGVPVAGQPSVSVVLATRRSDMVEFAVAQVARQRGIESLELIFAAHGFDPGLARVQDLAGPGVRVQVLTHDDDAMFGDVLNTAAHAAGGDVVLKMDDDDWYAPEAIADLLRARSYSGAELVGMPPEIHYLTEQDLTVRRGHPSELYRRSVAGGTMLVDASVLREVGGFRSVRKFVDAQLLDDVVSAGGAIYRTHGLGYVLRRNPTGHTWQVDLEFLLDPKRTLATHPGFHPSRLLELT
ncbi:MAG: glycosyltransferase family 2 protein [Nocardioides sp.]